MVVLEVVVVVISMCDSTTLVGLLRCCSLTTIFFGLISASELLLSDFFLLAMALVSSLLVSVCCCFCFFFVTSFSLFPSSVSFFSFFVVMSRCSFLASAKTSPVLLLLLRTRLFSFVFCRSVTLASLRLGGLRVPAVGVLVVGDADLGLCSTPTTPAEEAVAETVVLAAVAVFGIGGSRSGFLSRVGEAIFEVGARLGEGGVGQTGAEGVGGGGTRGDDALLVGVWVVGEGGKEDGRVAVGEGRSCTDNEDDEEGCLC